MIKNSSVRLLHPQCFPSSNPFFSSFFDCEIFKSIFFLNFSPSVPFLELSPPAVFSPNFRNPSTAYLHGYLPFPSPLPHLHFPSAVPYLCPNLPRVFTTRGRIVLFCFVYGSPLTRITQCCNPLIKSGIRETVKSITITG